MIQVIENYHSIQKNDIQEQWKPIVKTFLTGKSYTLGGEAWTPNKLIFPEYWRLSCAVCSGSLQSEIKDHPDDCGANSEALTILNSSTLILKKWRQCLELTPLLCSKSCFLNCNSVAKRLAISLWDKTTYPFKTEVLMLVKETRSWEESRTSLIV